MYHFDDFDFVCFINELGWTLKGCSHQFSTFQTLTRPSKISYLITPPLSELELQAFITTPLQDPDSPKNQILLLNQKTLFAFLNNTHTSHQSKDVQSNPRFHHHHLYHHPSHHSSIDSNPSISIQNHLWSQESREVDPQAHQPTRSSRTVCMCVWWMDS